MDMEKFAGSWNFFCGYVYASTNGRGSLPLWYMVAVSWVNISWFASQPQKPRKFYPPPPKNILYTVYIRNKL